MRWTMIATLAALLLIPVAAPAYSAGLMTAQITTDFSAATKKKKAPKQKKEKVEYMRSAAPPEPKK